MKRKYQNRFYWVLFALLVFALILAACEQPTDNGGDDDFYGIRFELPRYPLTMLAGGELAHAKAVVDASHPEDHIIWTTSNPTIARVSNGNIISVGQGTATITAETPDGIGGSFKVTVYTEDKLITNDTFWLDDAGNRIYSQSGDIAKFGDTYYWYGVRFQTGRTYADTGTTGGSTWEAITCYSSRDLVSWHYEGDILTRSQGTPRPPTGWVARLGVVYNQNTDKYVLISQGSGILFATGDTPTGVFTVAGTQNNLKSLGCFSNDTGDQTVFWDDDGTAYVVFCANGVTEPGQTAQPSPPAPATYRERDIVYVGKLNAEFTQVVEVIQLYSGEGMGYGRDGGREANCMFKYNGKYYLAASDLHGWNSSSTWLMVGDSPLGPFKSLDNMPNKTTEMEGTKTNFSHVSQVSFYETDIPGGGMVIQAGDRWSNMAGNGIGYNQWAPVSFEGGVPVFKDMSQFYLDISSGTWSAGPNNNYIQNPAFECDRVAGTGGQIQGYVHEPTGWVTEDDKDGTTQINYGGNRGTTDPYLLIPYASATPYGNYTWRQQYNQDYKATLKQTITDLPNGTYTMYAWVKSSGGQKESNIYIKNFGGDEIRASINEEINDWTLVVVSENIRISNGQCEIGVYSDALANQWVLVDDFALIKNKS
jgi:hypothetical protein